MSVKNIGSRLKVLQPSSTDSDAPLLELCVMAIEAEKLKKGFVVVEIGADSFQELTDNTHTVFYIVTSCPSPILLEKIDDRSICCIRNPTQSVLVLNTFGLKLPEYVPHFIGREVSAPEADPPASELSTLLNKRLISSVENNDEYDMFLVSKYANTLQEREGMGPTAAHEVALDLYLTDPTVFRARLGSRHEDRSFQNEEKASVLSCNDASRNIFLQQAEVVVLEDVDIKMHFPQRGHEELHDVLSSMGYEYHVIVAALEHNSTLQEAINWINDEYDGYEAMLALNAQLVVEEAEKSLNPYSSGTHGYHLWEMGIKDSALIENSLSRNSTFEGCWEWIQQQKGELSSNRYYVCPITKDRFEEDGLYVFDCPINHRCSNIGAFQSIIKTVIPQNPGGEATKPVCPIEGCRHPIDESEVRMIIERSYAESLESHESIKTLLKGNSRDQVLRAVRSLYQGDDEDSDWQVKPILLDGGRCLVYEISSQQAYNCVGKENSEFNQIAAQFSKLCQVDVRQVREVHKIEYSVDSPVLLAYHKKRQEFRSQSKPTKEILVFHGTGAEANFDSIASTGFKVGGQDGILVANGAAHGPGVYTAIGPATPMQYSAKGALKKVIIARALEGILQTDTKAPNTDWRVFQSGAQLLPVGVVIFG